LSFAGCLRTYFVRRDFLADQCTNWTSLVPWQCETDKTCLIRSHKGEISCPDEISPMQVGKLCLFYYHVADVFFLWLRTGGKAHDNKSQRNRKLKIGSKWSAPPMTHLRSRDTYLECFCRHINCWKIILRTMYTLILTTI
jgi:hypothetical protein